MRIGVFINEGNPEAGGAYSLLKTIREQLNNYERKYEIVFLYVGKITEPYKKERNGSIYLNINKTLPQMKRLLCKYLKLEYSKNGDCRIDRACEREHIDIVWFTSPTSFHLTYPYICTVWDLGHRVLPEFPDVTAHGQWRVREDLYRKMLPSASYIISGNNTGKKEIIENYCIPENRIKIAPFPLSSYCYGEMVKPDIDLSEVFFVYPAQFWPHKNHIRIIKACKILKDKYGISVKVYFTGSDHGNRRYIEDSISRYDVNENIEILGFVKSEELKYLISNAKAMIFASLMGPNNLPPMEAVYLGCPVIITDIPGHKEEMKDAAFFFNGYDENDLAEKMYMVLTDSNQVEDKIKKGKILAEEFQKINYMDTMIDIFKDFEKKLECWSET